MYYSFTLCNVCHFIPNTGTSSLCSSTLPPVTPSLRSTFWYTCAPHLHYIHSAGSSGRYIDFYRKWWSSNNRLIRLLCKKWVRNLENTANCFYGLSEQWKWESNGCDARTRPASVTPPLTSRSRSFVRGSIFAACLILPQLTHDSTTQSCFFFFQRLCFKTYLFFHKDSFYEAVVMVNQVFKGVFSIEKV